MTANSRQRKLSNSWPLGWQIEASNFFCIRMLRRAAVCLGIWLRPLLLPNGKRHPKPEKADRKSNEQASKLHGENRRPNPQPTRERLSLIRTDRHSVVSTLNQARAGRRKSNPPKRLGQLLQNHQNRDRRLSRKKVLRKNLILLSSTPTANQKKPRPPHPENAVPAELYRCGFGQSSLA